MIDLSKEQRMILLSISAVLISALIWGFYNRYFSPRNVEVFAASGGQVQISSDEKVRPFIIHISGAVKNQGVFRACRGLRIIDAVELAGGFLPQADISSINLAEELQDGLKVHVPFKASVREGGEEKSAHAASDLIGINSANEEDLKRIPGVGDATAKKIIEFRLKSGRFLKIEDLKKLGGIGDKKLEKMRPSISLN